MIVCSNANAQNTVWYNDHAKIVKPIRGFWAPQELNDHDGYYKIRANMLLDRGWCMNVKGRESFLIKLINKRDGSEITVLDDGAEVLKGASLYNWKGTLDNETVQVSWCDDEHLRQDARVRFPEINMPVPTRVIIYIKVVHALGGGDLWHVATIAPLAKRTETVQCEN